MMGGTTRVRALGLAIAAAAIVTTQIAAFGTAAAQTPSTLDIGVEHEVLH